MRCFNHSEVRTVGLCKNCLKGLCPDCLVEFGKGLACKGTCEADVAALIEYNNLAVSQGVKALKNAQTTSKGSSQFTLSLGILFFCVGLFESVVSGLGVWPVFNFLIGGLFMFHGWRQRKALK